MEMIGEFFGRLDSFGKVYAGEIALGPEVLAIRNPPKKMIDEKTPSPKIKAKVKSSLKDLQIRVGALQRSIPNI